MRVADTFFSVNIVSMVFCNRNEKLGTGGFFTRDLRNGEKKINLEFAFNAQGEDVGKGAETGMSLEKMLEDPKSQDIALQLLLIGSFLEQKYNEVQDIEFTFEHNEQGETTVFILQTRDAKRSAMATVRIANEMAHEAMDKARAKGELT